MITIGIRLHIDNLAASCYPDHTTMKRPELNMSQDWPDSQTRTGELTNLRREPVMTLFWPITHLPEDLGWLRTAEKLEGDVMGQYFLQAGVTFEDAGVYFSDTYVEKAHNIRVSNERDMCCVEVIRATQVLLTTTNLRLSVAAVLLPQRHFATTAGAVYSLDTHVGRG